MECVAISFSRGSFQPRDRTHVSCVASGFFTTEPLGKPSGTLVMLKIFFDNDEIVFFDGKLLDK